MAKEIKSPLKSEMCLGILNRVLLMEEPYPSAIAESLDQQFGNIQSYIDTMEKRGWIEKRKEGRKKILKINTWEIWKSTNHPNYIKLYTDDQIGDMWEKNEEVVISRLEEIKDESLDEDLKEFLINALEFRIKRAMKNIEKPERSI